VAANSSSAQDWPSPLAVQLAAEIRRWRQAAEFSEAHLAGVIGFTRQYISFAERPRRGLPSAALVQAIDEAVGAGGELVALRQRAYDELKAPRAGATSPPASTEAAERTPSASYRPGGGRSHETPRTPRLRRRHHLRRHPRPARSTDHRGGGSAPAGTDPGSTRRRATRAQHGADLT